MTLVDHIVRVVAEQRPCLLEVADELSNVHAATRVDIDEIEKDIRKLRGDVNRISLNAERMNDAHKEDAYPKRAADFAAAALPHLAKLDALSATTRNAYKEAVTFFGEVPSRPPQEWLAFVDNFVISFDKSTPNIN